MGVTKKKGTRVWGPEPRTYTNYGRGVPSMAKLIADLIKVRVKLNRFVESGRATESEIRRAARLADGLDVLLGVD